MIDEKAGYDKAEHVFSVATAAKNAELKRSLKDPQCWIEQGVLVLVGCIKVGCAYLAVKACVYAALLIAGLSLASEPELAPFVSTIVFFLVVLMIPLNPRGFFFRNVFAARAGHAFDAAADAAFKDYDRPTHRREI